jgi:hypothetical protein
VTDEIAIAVAVDWSAAEGWNLPSPTPPDMGSMLSKTSRRTARGQQSKWPPWPRPSSPLYNYHTIAPRGFNALSQSEAGRPSRSMGHVRGDPHHNFLRTAQWQRIRLAFLTHHPLCEHCTLLGLCAPATQADHIVRLVDNDHFKRTSWAGLQALCAGCHARKSKWERGTRRRPLRLGWDLDGYPVELGHGFVETPERLAFLTSPS